MHTLKDNGDGTWSVGYFAKNGNEWVVLETYGTRREAAATVSFLNGGDHPLRQPSPPDQR